MSQLYGLLAGLFVCASSWGVMTYVSQEVGWLVSLFLLMFFTVTTVYINGDEMHVRQKNLIKSFTDMEANLCEKLKYIEQKIDSLERKGVDGDADKPEAAAHPQELDSMIHMLEQILEEGGESDAPNEPQPRSNSISRKLASPSPVVEVTSPVD
jgi:hypothetical protein